MYIALPYTGISIPLSISCPEVFAAITGCLLLNQTSLLLPTQVSIAEILASSWAWSRLLFWCSNLMSGVQLEAIGFIVPSSDSTSPQCFDQRSLSVNEPNKWGNSLTASRWLDQTQPASLSKTESAQECIRSEIQNSARGVRHWPRLTEAAFPQARKEGRGGARVTEGTQTTTTIKGKNEGLQHPTSVMEGGSPSREKWRPKRWAMNEIRKGEWSPIRRLEQSASLEWEMGP